ncbi:hypothetical protein HYT51_02865 [Candidatus Woesearchaeota archaeon]|nr:hypothetical protein [Candidatus Woesearchaeota archaeon]
MNLKLGIVMFFLAFLVMPFVAAQNYRIDIVEVDGVVATATNTVFVERGETAAIEVWFTGIGPTEVDDARIKARIGGYEHGEIEDVSEIFTVETNVSYRKVLRLEIPEDIEIKEDGYILHVEIFDSDDELEAEYNLGIREKRHSLNIRDVIFSPGSLEVEAGKMLFASVRVENLGERKEEDIKVTMKVPELGLSTSTYIDELTTEERENDERDEETSASSDELVLRIPENADGTYDLIIEVEYNRGNTVEKKEYSLNVQGKAVAPEEKAELTVSVDKTSQSVKQGEGIVYQISFSNLGKEARAFTLDVNGEEAWARSRVEPQLLTVRADGTGEMFVFLSAEEDAALGSHVFTVVVMSGSQLIEEINLRADVTKGESSSAVPTGGDFSGFRKGLEVGFIVLLIILVILGIILAIRKMGREESKEGSEGKTYY